MALLSQTIGGTIGPTIAFADEITHPQEVTIHYDVSKLYEVDGTLAMAARSQNVLRHYMQNTMVQNKQYFVLNQVLVFQQK